MGVERRREAGVRVLFVVVDADSHEDDFGFVDDR
jgi:hypothetical protein